MSRQSERIEQYIRNTMTESEKSAFQFELMQDKNLREEVKAMRIMQKTVIAESRGKVSAGFNYRPLAYAATILFLVGAFFYFNQKETEVIVDNPVKINNSPSVKLPNDTTIGDEGVASQGNEEESINDDTNNDGPVKPDPITIEPSNPIALADPVDLVPNPLFEQMTTDVRGGNLKISPNSPSENAVLNWRKNTFVLPFTGNLSTDEEVAPTLNLLIFNNKKEDFEEWKYLKKEALTINASADGFKYFSRPKLQLKRGLYYYLIENEETEDVVFSGQFKVK